MAGHAGGVLYEVFWVLAVLFVSPGSRPERVALAVFAATSALEILQLWHPAFLEAVRSTFLGHALIGSTFAPADFAYYALGCTLGALGARALGLRGRAPSEESRATGAG